MAIEPIKGLYVHDEETDTDGIAKYDAGALENLDRSLTERYRAPDSKAVGDRLSAVEAVADEANQIAERLNEGGLELKDEVIAENISAWLNEHPEATTTVEDGALTQSKLSNSLDARKPSFYSTVSEMQEDDQYRLGATAISDGAVYTVRSAVEVNDPEDMVDPSVLYKYGGQYYHGGLTESDREIATGYECVNGFAIFVADYKNAYVTPEMFGAKGDGVTDDTRAWQKAVDAGLPVVAKSAQYKCGQINVTKNITIDCNGADFVCSSNRLFYCTGIVNNTISDVDYSANKPYSITATGYTNYTGFAMLKGTNNFELARTYYLGGFTCCFQNGKMCGTYPIDVTSVSIELVTPITAHLKNVGKYTHVSPSTSTKTIEFLYGLGSTVENVRNKESGGRNVLIFNCCMNCHAINWNVEHTFTSSDSNSYIVSFANSSFCSVKESYMYNEKWHCITTGDTYLCYNNLIENSETYCNDQYAICDHENGLKTTLRNVTTTGAYLGGLCDADGVTIVPQNGTNKGCLICLSPVSDERNAVYNVRNVELKKNPDASGANYSGMWFSHSPKTTGNTYYYKTINISNVHITGGDGNMQFSLPSTSTYIVKDVFVDSVNLMLVNIGLSTAQEAYIDDTNYRLFINNVNGKCATTYNYVGYSGRTLNEVNLNNCTLHYIGGTMKKLHFSNLTVDQAISSLVVTDEIYGTGLHSKFDNAVLLSPSSLCITDMRLNSTIMYLNISRSSSGCYYQRWYSGTMTTYEITSS